MNKSKNKNLQPSREKTKAFIFFKNKNKNLQLPRDKTKAFNLFKSKNKNLQLPRTKIKTFNFQVIQINNMIYKKFLDLILNQKNNNNFNYNT